MLKRFFLSIIILSALTSEGGAFYTADLFNYCLVNLAHLDATQDGIADISGFVAQKLNTVDKKGTPVAFFKMISQNSINSKAAKRDNHLEFLWMPKIAVILAILIGAFIYLYNKISFTRLAFLSLTDSSPPAFC